MELRFDAAGANDRYVTWDVETASSALMNRTERRGVVGSENCCRRLLACEQFTHCGDTPGEFEAARFDPLIVERQTALRHRVAVPFETQAGDADRRTLNMSNGAMAQ